MKRHLLFIVLAAIMYACGGTHAPKELPATDSVACDDYTDTIVVEDEPAAPEIVTLDHDVSAAEELMEFMRSSEHWEEYQRGIIPRIAEQSVEYAQKLLASSYPYFIIVDKGSRYVILYNRFGEEIDRYRMCCSSKYGTKHAKRDNRTPEGFFAAGLTYDSTDWLYTDDDGKTSPVKGQFGPRFIRVTNPVTTQVGIHGTCAPWSLGGRSSHGCIRIHNDNIMKLVEFVTPGTPIIINPSDRDQAVNRDEGYNVVQLILGKKKKESRTEEKPDTIQNVILTDSLPQRPDSIPECETPDPLVPEEHDSTRTTNIPDRPTTNEPI